MFKDLIIYTPMYVTLFWAVVLLLSKRSTNRAKHFLGVFMILAFFIYLSHAVYFKKHNDVFLYFDPLYNFASLSVYPLYYWYIKLLTVDTHVNLKNLRLLLPALLFGLATLGTYWFMSHQERINYVDGFLFKEPVNTPDTFGIMVQKGVYILSRLTFTVQVVFFLIVGSRLVKRYNSRVANFYANLENRTIAWVNLLLVSFVATSLVSIIFNIIGRAVFFDLPYLLIIPSVIFSSLLFLIGLQGYMQNYTVVNLITDEKQQLDFDLKAFNKELLKKKLLMVFEKDKIYRNSDLKITQVSVQLQTNRTYVSNLINNDFSCSFSEFVNQFRLLEAKDLLANPSTNNLSLYSISESVGFGSLGTFIRVFKECEGITPGRFRDKNMMQTKEKTSPD